MPCELNRALSLLSELNLIEGEPVGIVRKVQTGVDGYNAPVYADAPEPEVLEGVLVVPGRCAAISGPNRPDGVDIAYTLHFPKTFDEGLRGVEVVVRGRRCKVIGDPDHYTEESTPGYWWMPVEVEATDG